jgi:4-carboxymuconolactone decarboxylase
MGGNIDQLKGHTARALANGVTPEELGEAMTHLAFYAGWPKALSAVTAAREVIEKDGNA